MPTPPVRLDILAPLSGVLVPLDSVPDPVFAGKMVGDGVSLDPTSAEVLAPVAGTVTQFHPASHALAITTVQGLEVLLHVGIDTVGLGGLGFAPRVRKGDRVALGQPLVSFDPDLVAGKARSLLTQIVIPEGDRVRSMTPATGTVRAGQDVILSLELEPGEGAAPPGTALDAPGAAGAAPGPGCSPVCAAGAETVLSGPVALPNPAGMHARPAAVLAAQAKRYASDLRLVSGAGEANAKSVVAILGLALARGAEVRVRGAGPDAAQAVQSLAALLAEGCGERPGDAPVTVQPPDLSSPAGATAGGGYAGVPASPGLALGRVVQFRQTAVEVREQGGDHEAELGRLEAALAEARQQIRDLRARSADPGRGHILDAHLELLDDPELTGQATAGLTGGRSAAFAWQGAYTRQADLLAGLDNPLLRERAGDVRDVGRRVLTLLAGVARAVPQMGQESILVADELSPSDAAGLDRTKVLGFCTVTGGATGHVAILARSLGIPAVCGLDPAALDLADGTLAVLDGGRGVLRPDPDQAEVAEARARMAAMAQRREQELARAGEPARTADGFRVEVAANVVTAEDARKALANGAEGVGLLRSEFLFDNRDQAPDEEEQARAYLAVAEVMGPSRRVVIRTLDAGGDKPLSYLPLPREDNPFLGLRGVRVSLDRPDLFRVQLRAILRASRACDLHVMFPMVATLDELRAARAILAEEQAALGLSAKVGVMIEVPSAAILAEALAPEADFFSIGTNDLTQYTLAMDRGHPRLAKQADGLHPAVLRLIGMTCEAARRHGKWTGVCGGLASDLAAVPVLAGLGVDELSVSVPAVPAVKAALARFTMDQCRDLAREVTGMGTAAEVRARLAALTA